jgi:hypothetical protein
LCLFSFFLYIFLFHLLIFSPQMTALTSSGGGGIFSNIYNLITATSSDPLPSVGLLVETLRIHCEVRGIYWKFLWIYCKVGAY